MLLYPYEPGPGIFFYNVSSTYDFFPNPNPANLFDFESGKS